MTSILKESWNALSLNKIKEKNSIKPATEWENKERKKERKSEKETWEIIIINTFFGRKINEL